MQKLQKIISAAGLCSRRKTEVVISQRKVFANGLIACIGDRADHKVDEIKADGYLIPKETPRKVLLLNKPPAIISSCYDQFGRKTVLSLLPENLRKGMDPIVRLDYESRGALIITNHGELTLRLTHPQYKYFKTYLVWINSVPSSRQIKQWGKGVEIEEEKKTMPAQDKVVRSTGVNSLLEIRLLEERNRQIRKLASCFRYKAIDLKRISIANIKLNNLKEGQWRNLEEKELIPILKNKYIRN